MDTIAHSTMGNLVVGNRVTGNGTNNDPTTGDGISLENADNNVIRNNFAADNRRDGIRVDAASTGNRIEGNPAARVQKSTSNAPSLASFGAPSATSAAIDPSPPNAHRKFQSLICRGGSPGRTA